MAHVSEREYNLPLARRIRDLTKLDMIRTGNHDFRKLAKKHGVTQALLKSELGYILRAVSPTHDYFKGKKIENPWLHTRTKTMVEASYLTKGCNRKKLKRAVNRHLDKKNKTGFREKREDRVKKIINSLASHISNPKKSDLTRYELLEKVMEKHGFRYEQMKNDLYAIAYAVLVSPGEIYYPEDKSLRKSDINNARRTINNNNLGKKARTVAEWFISRTPETDLERIRQLHPTENLEVLRYQEEWANAIEELRQLHEQSGMHPVSAYAQAWKKAGYKEHFELPRNENWVYRIHEFTKKLKNGKSDKKMAEKLHVLGWSKERVLRNIEKHFGISPDMTPRELLQRIDQANLASWKSNYTYAQSKIQAQRASMTEGEQMARHLKAEEKWLEASEDHIKSDGIVAFAAGKEPKRRGISYLK